MGKQWEYMFGAFDYVIFVLLIVVSTGIGIYFCLRPRLFKRKEESFKDYIIGDKKMKPLPIATTLIGTYISGLTMLGTPAEIYNYGAQYFLVLISISLSSLTVVYVYLPVFWKLQVGSAYEYLEIRFNNSLRLVGSILFIFDSILFLPILVYVPSLAFAQATGLNVEAVGISITIICAFYTLVGGVRAVVYSDTLQTVIMFLANVVVIIIGTYKIGGISIIISRNVEGERMAGVSFNPSMYERFTFFSVVIGCFSYWVSFNTVNQSMVSKYLALPTFRAAKITVLLFTIGISCFIFMCCFCGILMHGYFYDCDPLTAGRVTKSDQLLPLFSLETSGEYYGVPGLFVAGVFSAALSTLSALLNAIAVVVIEDVFQSKLKIKLSDYTAKLLSKITVVVSGVISSLLLFVLKHMGGIFEVGTAISGIATGTMYGVFTLGMIFPWVSTAGAIGGAIGGFLLSCVVSFGQQYSYTTGLVVSKKLPINVDGCMERYNINVTAPNITYPDSSSVFPVFRIAYLWITPATIVLTLTVGLLTSFIVGKTDLKTLDPDLISPVCHWLLPEECKELQGTAVKKVEHLRLLGGSRPETEET